MRADRRDYSFHHKRVALESRKKLRDHAAENVRVGGKAVKGGDFKEVFPERSGPKQLPFVCIFVGGPERS